MKAVILAGGRGKRTGQYGEEKPKCLFEFNRKTILAHQLEALIANGIKDIIIITGYKEFMIKDFIKNNHQFSNLNIQYINNPYYETTNTSYGWWLCREYVKNEEAILHFNSDLIFFPELIKRVIEDDHKNILCIDRKVEFNDSMEQVILNEKTGQILHMDKANIPGAHGKGVGVAKFSNETINFILNKLDEFIIGKGDRGQNFYKMIRIAVKYLDFYGLDIGESFFREVNTVGDYDITKREYAKLILKELPKKSIKTIILAGGKGDRLKHFVENVPTALLSVENKPLLAYQLEALMANGINDIIVIIGYKGFMIKEFIKEHPKFKNLNITYVENDEYNTTGTAYGWWLAKSHMKNEQSVLHIHSDLIFSEDLIKNIIEDKRKNVICIDKKIGLNESMEQVILDLRDDKMLYMDKRNVPGAHGKAVGIAKFSNEAVEYMLNRIQAYVDLGDKNQAFYGIIRKTIHEHDFYGLNIENSFFREVNTVEDYQKTLQLQQAQEKPPVPEKTSVIMLYGLPVSGKTTASRKIRDYFEKDINIEVISTFKIREEKNLINLYSEEQRERVYDEICKVLEEKLQKNIYKCIILDGNFNKKERRQKVYNVLKRYNCDFYIIECFIENTNEIKKRLSERKGDFGVENAATSFELYSMIKNEGHLLSEDEFINPIPIIISFNTETNSVQLKPQQYLVRGIIEALKEPKPVLSNITEIIFVRHGETQNNKEGILQGHSDIPLNEQGFKEAEELALFLKDIKTDLIISSDLPRAMQCAKRIAWGNPHLAIIEEPLLREKYFGKHQGVSVLELGYPSIDYYNLTKHLYECNCPDGESNEQLSERIKQFLKKLVKEHSGKRMLVITHGGFIMLAINHLLKEEIKLENARQHKNGYVSYFKLDNNLNVIDSLIDVHASKVAGYLKINNNEDRIN
ncbi:histidine phosphatase family protein [Candidatus Pacearchaeota archaeon]|nr:histidine phosphatase family protein [Candidatus Pacearchaeota archaeon]